MNNKAHLRPKDYDSNGDIIPMSWKEEKGDLINRDALKRALHNFFDGKVIDEPTYILRDVFCYIDGAPAVDISGSEYFPYRTAYFNGVEDGRATARPQGEWIDTGDMNEYWAEEYQCSICGAKDHWHNFCPNCGACMKKGGAE